MNSNQPSSQVCSDYAISARERLQQLQKELLRGEPSSSPHLLLENFAHNAHEPGVGQVLAEALHEGFGSRISKITWQMLEEGIEQAAAKKMRKAIWEPSRIAFATLCLNIGAIDALRAVVQSRWPGIVPPDIMPSTESQWLNLLCTTRKDRDHPMFNPGAGLIALTAEIAAAKGGLLEHGYAAMELALEIDPDHSDVDDLLDDESPQGAYVRHFLMDRQIDASVVEAGLAPKDAPPDLRRNRTL
ncbi:hypothetical protein ABIC83_002493 [Roseateles asaccharophilus]|uniref:hypothetical protein n=1 Tax=Roseateles asaccharophilus TaxID=582607 RepID=UPI0038340A65